jgi:hypothetical protein
MGSIFFKILGHLPKGNANRPIEEKFKKIEYKYFLTAKLQSHKKIPSGFYEVVVT